MRRIAVIGSGGAGKSTLARRLGEGCPEKVDWEFLHWIWTFPLRNRPKLLARLEPYRSSKRVLHLRSSGEVDAFLAGVAYPLASR